MDKIWDRKSFEVGGHWPLCGDEKKRMTTQNRQKSNANFFLYLKKKIVFDKEYYLHPTVAHETRVMYIVRCHCFINITC